MFNIKESIFDQNATTILADDVKVIVVADLFVEDYVGGAELTTEALIEDCPLKVAKIKSKDVTIQLLEKAKDKFWIFGNFAQLNFELVPTIVGNINYSILEYDYKYCRYRSPEKHQTSTGLPCDCHNQMNGKLISAFYYGSRGLWWMSEAQKDRYLRMFPFLAEKDNIVLSSVFSKKTLGTIKFLREKFSTFEKNGWIVLGSNSWVKGAEAAEQWCKENHKQYEVVWNVSYDQMLAKLATSEGFVYLPAGADTCPRMVIEAKLLGCKLQLNSNVQHKDEPWFATENLDEIEEYLFGSPQLFWNGIKKMMAYKPTVSGYTTVFNAVEQQYPFEQSIQSMLQFCDEVCVVDGGSSDGTWEILQKLANDNQKIKLKKIERDWNHPRFAVFDGMQKAEARKMCTMEYCWQMDSDEIVHEEDCQKIIDLCKKFPAHADLLSLPVVEYWGGPEKVRVDIFPWKWRLSRNKPNITHGIPKHAKRYDNDGHLYAAYGDGCDMIDADSEEPIIHLNFYSKEADAVRNSALSGDKEALQKYENWLNKVVEELPGVFHYSWYDISRKIKLYKNYWTKHWEALSGKSYEDTAESNMMFDLPWSKVNDEMIEKRAIELKENLGGWIWHSKWDGIRKTPSIVIKKSQPKIMVKE